MKVSILMPVYNGASTIELAIKSILCQNWTNWECIIVNDGSTDQTKNILSEITDKRFQVINLERNSGRGIARDIALKHASGEYIAYLDADDMMHEDKLRVQVEYMEKHQDIRLVSCGCITLDKAYKPMRVCNMNSVERSEIYKYGEALPLLLGAIMVRLHHAQKISYNHALDVGEDYDYFSRYLDGGRYANIPLPYYYYLTGTNTARKVINYQIKDLKSCWALIQNGAFRRGCKELFMRIGKLIAYFVLIPFFGAERLVNMRGNSRVPTPEQCSEFNRQLDRYRSEL